MCKQNGNGLTDGVADPAGRPLDLEYKRNSCYCERCQMRRTQVFGRWCCQCWDVLLSDAYYDETTEFLRSYDYLFSQHDGSYE